MTRQDRQRDQDPAAQSAAADAAIAARVFERFTRISWRDALGGLTSAALRLHRYRGLRTQILHDALCETDCRDDAGAKDDT
jgi:hypothetical protein